MISTKNTILRISTILAIIGTLVAFQNCTRAGSSALLSEVGMSSTAFSSKAGAITAQAARESASARTQELL